jgi:hypothetical protein
VLAGRRSLVELEGDIEVMPPPGQFRQDGVEVPEVTDMASEKRDA